MAKCAVWVTYPGEALLRQVHRCTFYFTVHKSFQDFGLEFHNTKILPRILNSWYWPQFPFTEKQCQNMMRKVVVSSVIVSNMVCKVCSSILSVSIIVSVKSINNFYFSRFLSHLEAALISH